MFHEIIIILDVNINIKTQTFDILNFTSYLLKKRFIYQKVLNYYLRARTYRG